MRDLVRSGGAFFGGVFLRPSDGAGAASAIGPARGRTRGQGLPAQDTRGGAHTGRPGSKIFAGRRIDVSLAKRNCFKLDKQ